MQHVLKFRKEYASIFRHQILADGGLWALGWILSCLLRFECFYLLFLHIFGQQVLSQKDCCCWAEQKVLKRVWVLLGKLGHYRFFNSSIPFALFSTIYDFSLGTFGTKVEICSTKKSSAMYKNTLGGNKRKRLLWLPYSSPGPRLLIIAGYCRTRMANFFIISALNCQNDLKKENRARCLLLLAYTGSRKPHYSKYGEIV